MENGLQESFGRVYLDEMVFFGLFFIEFALVILIFTVKFRMMHARSLKFPNNSFFLFGPRGVGKSTWLKQWFPDAFWVDLLPPTNALRYMKDPNLLSMQIKNQPLDQWIVIDEIQKSPELLDEVHNLMENFGYKYFALSGSSARKLKRGAANMLAGRAVTRSMLPFTANELNFDIDYHTVLEYGLLPLSVNADSDAAREDFLRSYLTTYIQEEIKAEGFVRNIGHFSRFLDIAALSAATQPNISGLSRDAGIGRDTVQGYFGVFEDTLLGSWLRAYRPRAKVKEVSKPKFYWFDSGVLNAAAGAFDQPMPREWTGVLLEHWVYHELMAYMSYNSVRGSLGYWRTPSGTEVDFIWWYGSHAVGIEVKSSKAFQKDYLKGLKSLEQSLYLHRSFIAYLGSDQLRVGNTQVLPVLDFLRKLHKGEVIGY